MFGTGGEELSSVSGHLDGRKPIVKPTLVVGLYFLKRRCCVLTISGKKVTSK